MNSDSTWPHGVNTLKTFWGQITIRSAESPLKLVRGGTVTTFNECKCKLISNPHTPLPPFAYKGRKESIQLHRTFAKLWLPAENYTGIVLKQSASVAFNRSRLLCCPFVYAGGVDDFHSCKLRVFLIPNNQQDPRVISLFKMRFIRDMNIQSGWFYQKWTGSTGVNIRCTEVQQWSDCLDHTHNCPGHFLSAIWMQMGLGHSERGQSTNVLCKTAGYSHRYNGLNAWDYCKANWVVALLPKQQITVTSASTNWKSGCNTPKHSKI